MVSVDVESGVWLRVGVAPEGLRSRGVREGVTRDASPRLRRLVSDPFISVVVLCRRFSMTLRLLPLRLIFAIDRDQCLFRIKPLV